MEKEKLVLLYWIKQLDSKKYLHYIIQVHMSYKIFVRHHCTIQHSFNLDIYDHYIIQSFRNRNTRTVPKARRCKQCSVRLYILRSQHCNECCDWLWKRLWLPMDQAVAGHSPDCGWPQTKL